MGRDICPMFGGPDVGNSLALFRHFSDNSPAWLCCVVQIGQRAPTLSLYKSIAYVVRSVYEPGGREFESLQARQ